MRTISLVCLLVLTPAAAFAAEEIMHAAARNRQNLAAEFRTMVEPSDLGLGLKSWGGGVQVTNDGVFHRFILDQANKTYVGYDVRIEEGPDKPLLLLTIEPFSLAPGDLPIDDPDHWKTFRVVRERKTQSLELLESVALDLLVQQFSTRDGTMTQTVVDYITVGRDLDRLRRPRKERSEPRPFKAEDTEMEINTPRIVINGEQFHETNGTSSAAGATLGLYIKNRGRFLFSMFPHEELGFERLGWVSRTLLHFEWAGDKFEIESHRRIVPGAGPYYVYVHADPGYRPTGVMANQDIYFFAAGPPASLLESERR